MKLLFFDVEMALQVGYFYDQWNTNIPAHKIKHHGFMISAAWSWYGRNKIDAVSVLDDPKRFKKNHRDDFHVIKKLSEVVNEADAIVAFNGDNFDMKELNTGLIKHSLEPLKHVVQIDPYKIAKKHFRFKGGNSLRNLCEFLDVKAEKGKVDDDVWIAAAEGDPAAIKKVLKYNKGDIPTLKQVYEKIKPFTPAKLNLNHFVEADVCPSCASPDFIRYGRFYRMSGFKQQFRCNDCGHQFLSKKTFGFVNMR